MKSGEVVYTTIDFLVASKLSRYADQLVQQDGLQLTDVQTVTDADLLRLGITKEFHRLRFLREARQMVAAQLQAMEPAPEPAQGDEAAGPADGGGCCGAHGGSARPCRGAMYVLVTRSTAGPAMRPSSARGARERRSAARRRSGAAAAGPPRGPAAHRSALGWTL